MAHKRQIEIFFVIGVVVSGWLISGVSVGFALSASTIEKSYKELMQWRTVDGAVITPGKEIIIESDCAKWTLKSGSVAYVNPVGDKVFTGFVFEGEGIFEMDIPDPVERDQLLRFSDAKIKDRIRLPFKRCIIRDSGNRLQALNIVNATGSPIPNEILRKRHETDLKSGFMDIDARVLMGVLNDKDDFLFADIETTENGWLTYLFDRDEQEEVRLLKFDEKLETFDTWISLDREVDRLVSGRPSRSFREIIDIVHVDMEVDLTDVKWVSSGTKYQSKTVKSDSKMIMKVRFKPALEGIRCIEFDLESTAKVTGVKNGKGQDLTFIRDHIGDRSMLLEDELWDDSLYVFFPEALTPGTEYEIQVSYDLEIKNFASGRSWYPSGPGGFSDQHTVSFKAILDEKFDIFAVGRKVQEQIESGRKISSWQTTSPTAMYGFTYGKDFEQERISIEGMPDVISFGTEHGFTTGNMVRNVGIDVANSLKFYMWLLDEEMPNEPIYVTSIDAWHGQAFEGLIHLAKYTYLSEHPGETELFRAHETAHQFWGHVVGWQTYRDQWISEGFSEYFAMLFLETTMDNPKFFEDTLESHAMMAIGAAGYKLNDWSRPWSQTVPGAKMKNIGPIDVGYRAATIDLPSGYYIQAYEKGAMVLHMIRVHLRNSTRSEDAFRDVIRTFLKTYRGKNPTTSDFQTVLESRTKSDWGWFFDQWIDHSYIPRYEWSWDLGKKNDDGNYPLTVTIRQSGVPDNFRMIVPLVIDYKNGKRAQMMLPVDKPENTFTFDVNQKPQDLILNPDWSVLAEVKKK